MNILVVTPIPPDPHGGGAIAVLLDAQIRALQKHHSLTLVTVAGPDPAEWEAVDRIEQSGIRVRAVRRTNPSGAKRWERRWRFGSSWLRGQLPWRTIWFTEPGVQQILDELFATERFDIIQVEDNAAGTYAFAPEIPLLLTEHEVRQPRPMDWYGISRNRSAFTLLSELDWQRWRDYQRAVWSKADRIQVFTDRDAESVRSQAPEMSDRVRVNPFPVGIPNGHPVLAEQDRNVLFIGNFTHPPNVDSALWLGREIMPLIREEVPGATLTIVGGYAPAEVRALENSFIEVTGFVPDLVPYYDDAAVFVAPIRIGGGMRMKVLQAMAHGNAVVTTPRGADGLAVPGQTLPLRIASDSRGIAGAAVELLTNAGMRAGMSRDARAFVTQFHSPEAYIERLNMVYDELVVNHAAVR